MSKPPTTRLSRDNFARVVRLTPLVSIDLIVRNPRGEVLVGLRTNEPARGFWFVPGGRIGKGERIAAAFARLTEQELGEAMDLAAARFLGVYEHLYETNFAMEEGFGTHYVVLGYEITLDGPLLNLPDEQHSGYRWMAPQDILASDEVHVNTQAYFTDPQGR
ncbi:MAG: GDP-mannose mannosyl hydrolase [Phycisphaerae bacterium]